MKHRYHHRLGISMLEVVMTISVLGILLALAVPSFRSPDARLLANDVQALLQQARFEAIKRNRPISVLWNAQQGLFIVRLHNDSSTSCSSTDVQQLRTKSATDYRDVQVTTTLSGNGLVWLPTGLPNPCGQGSAAGDITFRSGSSSARVTVSAGGRIKSE